MDVGIHSVVYQVAVGFTGLDSGEDGYVADQFFVRRDSPPGG
jgi:hypothetical protein